MIQLCRYISSKMNTRTNLLHWLRYNARGLHMWISEIFYAQSDDFLEPLNNENFSWSFNLKEVDCKFLLESLLLVEDNIMMFTLQLVCDALCISQNLLCCLNLNNGRRELKLHILGRDCDCCPISQTFCGRFHLPKLFGKYTSVPDWLCPNVQQYLMFIILKQLIEYLQFHQHQQRELAINFRIAILDSASDCSVSACHIVFNYTWNWLLFIK